MAQIVLTVADNQVARIQEAYGSLLELGRDATANEIQAEIIRAVKENVQRYERAKAIKLAVAVVQEPTPIPIS